MALLNDPAFIDEFRREWQYGRGGNNLATFKANMGVPDKLVVRDLHMLIFDGAPVADWDGENMQQVFDRVVRYQRGATDEARSAGVRVACVRLPKALRDEAGVLVHMMGASV